MTFERIKGNSKNKFKKGESDYIILVGSENGNTKSFAKMLYQAFLKANKKAYITDLNSYTSFQKMQHLIVLTSTYGDGDPPSNASNFLKVIKNKQQNGQAFSFSVVAFGSTSYLKFCQFGIEVHEALAQKESATELLPLQTINNSSFQNFYKWNSLLSKELGFDLKLNKKIITKQKKTTLFTVIEKKLSKAEDDTFLIVLKSEKQNFTSGDLLAIYPNENEVERLYSIAKIGKTILLSIKKHQLGVCSNYLFNLEKGDELKGYIKKNKQFHFPKKASKVIMIANGTGIAPFLGMINSQGSVAIDLYFGLANKLSLSMYDELLDKERIPNLHLAFSREIGQKTYVQDLVKNQSNNIVNEIKSGKAILMICGALAMQKDVFDILEEELKEEDKSLSYYQANKKIFVDCY